MITCYFGVPGVGKSTTLVKMYKKLHRKYNNVYTINIEIKGCIKITKEDFENYKFNNDLILWDEITLDYDNRNFKSFSQNAKESWLMHRHMGVDIIYATQNYENVDKKIRDITQELWYMSKSIVPIIGGITHLKKVYRTIVINEMNGDLILGYRFCNGLERIFAKNNIFVLRKLYYKYFDTNELGNIERRKLYGTGQNSYNNNDSYQFNNMVIN